MKFNNNDELDIYCAYDFNISIPTSNGDVTLNGMINDEPSFESVCWKDIKAINSKSGVFKNKIIRFAPNIEDDALKALYISNVKNVYSREEIEFMVQHPSDKVFKKITEIKDKQIINQFLTTLVVLKNDNRYSISEKLELYIRARKEELENGMKDSELEIDETINLAVIEDENQKEEILDDISENESDETIAEEKETKKKVSGTKKSASKKNTTK